MVEGERDFSAIVSVLGRGLGNEQVFLRRSVLLYGKVDVGVRGFIESTI